MHFNTFCKTPRCSEVFERALRFKLIKMQLCWQQYSSILQVLLQTLLKSTD